MNATDERRALLANVLAQPDDDTARLVFADWLQEHGEEDRAHYIRAAIAHPTPWPSKSREGEPAVMTLMGRIVGEGVERRFESVDVEIAPAIPGVSWGVRRGFVEFVECSAADWLYYCDAILAEYPVTKVRLTTHTALEALDVYSDRCYFRFPGRTTRRLRYAAGTLISAAGVQMHETEWPGITFTLPA